MCRTAFQIIPVSVLFGLLSAHAQEHAFEVASIKPIPDDPTTMVIGLGLRHGTLQGQKVTLRMLVAAAYGLTEPRVLGPAWLDKDRFDIVAKSPAGVPDSELNPMLQRLLKDRFKLSSHLEKKRLSVYYLNVAKGGAKMPKYPARDSGPDRPGPDYPGAMMRGTFTMPQLADLMSHILERAVIDKTGLTERYSVYLTYAPLTANVGESAFGPADFFKSVQDQLGLKLQPSKDDVDVVIVDHVERMPTEN